MKALQARLALVIAIAITRALIALVATLAAFRSKTRNRFASHGAGVAERLEISHQHVPVEHKRAWKPQHNHARSAYSFNRCKHDVDVSALTRRQCEELHLRWHWQPRSDNARRHRKVAAPYIIPASGHPKVISCTTDQHLRDISN
jgi:hypothetical protein